MPTKWYHKLLLYVTESYAWGKNLMGNKNQDFSYL